MKSNMHKRHRIPRKQPLPVGQRLTAWLMLLLTVALALVLIGGRA